MVIVPCHAASAHAAVLAPGWFRRTAGPARRGRRREDDSVVLVSCYGGVGIVGGDEAGVGVRGEVEGDVWKGYGEGGEEALWEGEVVPAIAEEVEDADGDEGEVEDEDIGVLVVDEVAAEA